MRAGKGAYFIIILTVLLPQIIVYQIHSQPANFVFRHLKVEDGLSQSTVHSIAQDRNGFMWFGTDNGLNKYDGNKFVVYHHNTTDPASIASNFIVEIYEDSHHCLWIGNGYNGLDLFDRNNEVFIHYVYDSTKAGSISNNNIRAVYEDRKKNLWVGTSGGGLNLYNRTTNTFTHILNNRENPNSPGSNHISSIAEDLNGNLWMGSTEGILIKFDPRTNTFTNFPLYGQFKADLYNTTFCNTYVDSENNVWFGTEMGLFVFNQHNEKFTHYFNNNTKRGPNSNAISSVLEYEKDIFLIATDHGGLNVFNKKTGLFTYLLNKRYDETTISNNQLYNIYRTANGIIWIGSFHGGVNVFDKNAIKFQQYKYLLSGADALNCCNSVISLAEDNDKNIWVGYDGQGLDIFNPRTRQMKHITLEPGNQNTISSNCITEIYKDKNNNMWIGTYLEGLTFYNAQSKKYSHFKHQPHNPNSICGNNVWSITENKKGYILIGTIGSGASVYNPSTEVFTHFSNSLQNDSSISNNDVFKIFEDRAENLWIGTRNGLNLQKKGQKGFKRFVSDQTNKNGIFGAWVYDIFQDSHGNIWIGTDLALNLYQPELNRFMHFMEKDGLRGNAILCIMEDSRQNLWISTNKGLTKFNYNDRTFKNYDIADGLQGNEFNYTSSLLASDGRMYFGGKNGFNVFHPDSIIHNQTAPPVFLTNFSILNNPVTPRQQNPVLSQHINYASTIALSYRQNVISFEFAALNFTNPKKNQYAYMLVGFDKDWNHVGNRNDVTYTNLNPGNYTFKVKASNNDGVWNEEGTQVQIIINPPFWKTKWFLAVQLLLAIFLVYLFIIFREKKLQSDKKNLQKKVQERTLQIEMQKKELENHRNHLEQLIEIRTEELRAAKDRAEESDRLKSAFLANMSHEIRTPMNAIVGFSNLLNDPDLTMDERSEYVGLINSNSESLLVLIEDILDLSLIEANQIIMRNSAFELNEFLEQIHSSYTVSNKKKSLKFLLNNSLFDSKLKLNTDQYRLKQILINLLNNAYKYTEKGYVELGCNSNGPHLVFYVKDTGIGISKEDVTIIFDRFRKLENNYSTAYRGAGLGLAISKRLSEILGGAISVTSAINEGSVFKLEFELNNIITNEAVKAINPHINIGLDWNNKRILIVEDEEANYKYLQKVLQKTRANIEWAENGQEAVNVFKRNNGFDLILMDIKMPIMNGYEAAKIIKTEKPQQIIIAQTAYARPEDEYELRQAGFNGYLSKPINADMLYLELEKYL